MESIDYRMLHCDYVPVAGKSPVVVFIHGDLQNGSSFNRLAAWFRQRGHSTLQIDLPGHGFSPPSERPILEMIDEELSSRGIVNPILVGHSSGGVVAAQYALCTGNAASLIALNSCLTNPLRFNPALANIGDLLLAKSAELFVRQERPDYCELSRMPDSELRIIGFRTTSPAGLKSSFSFMRGIPSDQSLSALNIPVLMLNDVADNLLPMEGIRELSSQIHRLVIEEISGGHNSLLRDISEVSEAIGRNSEFICVSQSKQRTGILGQ